MEKQIQVLRYLLRDGSDGVRQAASDALSRLETAKRLPDIVRRLGNGTGAEKVEAVYALQGVAAPDAKQLLAKLLSHPIEDIRAAALRAAAYSRDPSFLKPIVERLNDDSSTVVEIAIDVLAELGERRAEPRLLQLLKSGSDNVKAAALRALGQLHSPRAAKLAVNAVKSPSPSIRLAAAEVLGMVLLEEE